MFALTRRPPSRSQLDTIDLILERTAREFSFCAGIDAAIYDGREVIEEDAYLPVRFTIKVLSLRLSGEPFENQIHPFRLCDVPYLSLNHLSDHIDLANDALCATTAELARKLVCRWIMKHLIRSGYELNVRQEKFYSRDLFPCAEAFATRVPALKSLIWRAVSLGINPTSNFRQVRSVINELGPFILSAASFDSRTSP